MPLLKEAATRVAYLRARDMRPETAYVNTIYPVRMFGVRTVVIGAELLLPQEEERALAMKTGILIHASDTLAAGLGGLRRQLPPHTAALLTGVSAVNTALAIVGSSPPRAKPHRRWFRR